MYWQWQLPFGKAWSYGRSYWANVWNRKNRKRLLLTEQKTEPRIFDGYWTALGDPGHRSCQENDITVKSFSPLQAPKRDTPSTEQLCRYCREESFGEREHHHMHTWYVLSRIVSFLDGRVFSIERVWVGSLDSLNWMVIGENLTKILNTSQLY